MFSKVFHPKIAGQQQQQLLDGDVQERELGMERLINFLIVTNNCFGDTETHTARYKIQAVKYWLQLMVQRRVQEEKTH